MDLKTPFNFQEPYVASNVEFSIHDDGHRIVLFSLDSSERVYLTVNSAVELREWLGKVIRADNAGDEKPVTVAHAPTCPVSQHDFRVVEGLVQCNCDFMGRLRQHLSGDSPTLSATANEVQK